MACLPRDYDRWTLDKMLPSRLASFPASKYLEEKNRSARSIYPLEINRSTNSFSESPSFLRSVFNLAKILSISILFGKTGWFSEVDEFDFLCLTLLTWWFKDDGSCLSFVYRGSRFFPHWVTPGFWRICWRANVFKYTSKTSLYLGRCFFYFFLLLRFLIGWQVPLPWLRQQTSKPVS